MNGESLVQLNISCYFTCILGLYSLEDIAVVNMFLLLPYLFEEADMLTMYSSSSGNLY